MASNFEQTPEIARIFVYSVTYVEEGMKISTTFAATCAYDITEFLKAEYPLAQILSVKRVGFANLIKDSVE